MRSFIFFISVLFFSLQASADVTFVGASGLSVLDTTSTANTITIYGGFAGEDNVGECLTSKDNINACNNCAGAIEVCNQSRSYGNLLLKISFTDSENTGQAHAVFDSTSIVTDSSSSNTTETGSTSTVVMTWANLCSVIGASAGGGTCDTSVTKTIKVGIQDSGTTLKDSIDINIVVHKPPASGDASPEHELDICTNTTATTIGGICDFVAFPGDEKVYITTPESTGPFPTLTNINITHLRVFYGTDGFANINNASSSVDLQIESTSSGSTEADLVTRTVNGLENDQVYFFRVASVDQAGNVTRITNDNAIANTATSGCSSATAPATEFLTCDYMAKPSEVLGLLSDDLNCFIATATYGSSMSSKVKTFRKFRGEVLLKSKLGKKLNRLYYNYGPKLARLIHKSKPLKAGSRVLLWPAWAFAALSLQWGFWWSLFVFAISGGLLIYGLIIATRLTQARVKK